MEAFADVAPAHNPPYIKAMRMLRERFPQLPLVAAFETGFHRTIPEANQRYAIPEAWATELGVRRWGFHGASHRYIAGRMAELLGRADLKVISCHLGGSSSLCAIRDGESVACSLGMSPQSGLPHNNRVGDFDVFALPVMLRETGKSLDEILDILAEQSGLEGIGGAGATSATSRPRPTPGNGRAQLAHRRVHRARSATTWAPTSSSWAGPTPSSSPAGSARTRRGSARASAATSDWFGIELDPRSNAVRARRAPASRPPAPASRSGPCRPTRRSSSPGRPGKSWSARDG